MNGITVEQKVHFGRGRRREKKLRIGKEPSKRQGRLPRITKLMALAIKFDQMIRDGVVAGYAELATLGHVSRARMTQIMNLLNLAPDIQEAILFLPRVERGKDAITERELRAVVAEASWERQREMWIT